jgi:hypothetical protein
MKCNFTELPTVNRRLKKIVDDNFNGNVRKFSFALGLTDSSKVNRLFNIEKRTGTVPPPSYEILLLIAIKLGYSIDWIMLGIGEEKLQKIEIAAEAF